MATELGCGMKCLKYMLFAVNFVVWICGIVVFGVGIYSRVKAGEWEDLVKDASVADAANILIASGAIVMVIGFVGCCGAVKQNRPFLIVYIILLMLIFILEIASGIYAYTKKDDVIASLKSGFQETVDKSYGMDSEADKGLTKSVDWFQEHVKCCGANGVSSWRNSTWKTEKSGTQLVPKSCCKNQDSSGCNVAGSYTALGNSGKVYTKGCVEQGDQYLRDHMLEIGGVGVGIAFVQLVGIVFAILLVKAINENKL